MRGLTQDSKRPMAYPKLGELLWGMGQGRDLSQVCMGSADFLTSSLCRVGAGCPQEIQ